MTEYNSPVIRCYGQHFADGDYMTDWLTKLVVGQGNVIRERSLTNWNTFDASKVVEEKKKEREKSSSAAASGGTSAESSEDRNTERE